MVLSQRNYILDILVDSGLEGCRSNLFLMEQNMKLNLANNTPLFNHGSYRLLNGRLLCLQVTRLDIKLSMNTLI